MRETLLEVEKRLNGLDLSKADNVYLAIARVSEPGDHDLLLYAALRYLKQQSSVDRKVLREIVSDLSGFYADSSVPELAKMMQAAQEKLHSLAQKQALMAQDLTGMQLMHNTAQQGVLLLPDASEAGRVRASYFDQRGFYSHITRDTYSEILDEVWREGFRKTDSPALEKWAMSETWQEGSELTLAIQQVELGKMEYTEYVALAQWHSNKKMLQPMALALSQSGLTVEQARRELQRSVKQELGVVLSEPVADALILAPNERPDLSAGLFNSKCEPVLTVESATIRDPKPFESAGFRVKR